MLKLFKVVADGRDTQHFDNKRMAKHRRDRLEDEGVNARVMRGPDHWKGEQK
jgi:hypothetical protein